MREQFLETLQGEDSGKEGVVYCHPVRLIPVQSSVPLDTALWGSRAVHAPLISCLLEAEWRGPGRLRCRESRYEPWTAGSTRVLHPGSHRSPSVRPDGLCQVPMTLATATHSHLGAARAAPSPDCW